MELIHDVYDTDSRFSINPTSRAITKLSEGDIKLVQYDHNSERFAFEIPRYVDGHDMSLCTSAQVHYINIGAKERQEGIYDITDLQVDVDDDNKVICSWLISQNATMYSGSINFMIRFKCVNEAGSTVYMWNTETYTGMLVSSSMDNTDSVIEQRADILEQWRSKIFGASIKDLGELTTQEQLDDLMLLDEGWARFETLMALTVSDSYRYKVILGSRTSNYPLVYMVFTIRDANDDVKQYFFNSVTNTSMYPSLFYRGGSKIQADETYTAQTAAVIYDSNMTDLSLYRLKTSYIQADSGTLTFQGDKFNFDSGEVEFYENVAVSFDGDVSFAKRFMIKPEGSPENPKPVAYSTEFSDSTGTTDVNLMIIPPYYNYEYLYGIINSLSISGQYTLGTDDMIAIHFDTGEVAPTVSYQMQGNGRHLNWIGTDCSLDEGISVFAPSPNMHYDVYLYDNGTHLIGLVNGFVPATGNTAEA